MKRLITLLLATMLLAVCLTACGRRDNYGQDSQQSTTNQTTGAAQNNTAPGYSGEDAVLGSGNQTTGETHTSGQERPNDSANNHAANEDVGVSYEQMLRNGRVHDKDGLLKDGENAVSDLMGNAKDAARDLARDAKTGMENLMR